MLAMNISQLDAQGQVNHVHGKWTAFLAGGPTHTHKKKHVVFRGATPRELRPEVSKFNISTTKEP